MRRAQYATDSPVRRASYRAGTPWIVGSTSPRNVAGSARSECAASYSFFSRWRARWRVCPRQTMVAADPS